MGNRFYVVKEQAVPEVLLKVVEAKKLLDSGRAHTVNEAADQVGISRSSFYKISLSSMSIPRERRSLLPFRWRMSRGFSPMC